MKKVIAAAAMAALLALGTSAEAAQKWDLPLIGHMTVPQNVTIEAGEQAALAFGADGPKWSLTKDAVLEGSFWTITQAVGTDFTYGWAASATLGAQYLQKAGVSDYKGKSVEEQMDLIAADLNRKLIEKGAVFAGDAPLVRSGDKKHPRWEDSFIITRKEKDITYREAYHAVLQVAGFRVALGLIANDAEAAELSDALGKMLARRSFYNDKELLAGFLKK